MIHIRHRWEVVERIGRVAKQRCRCGKTRIRIIKIIYTGES